MPAVRRAPASLSALALLLCAGATGCGSDGAQLTAWGVEPPYLPPRDPAALAAPAAQPTEAGAGAGSAAAAARRAESRPSEERIADGAPTDAEVEAALREAYGGAGATDVDRATVDPSGRATIPATAPRKLVALMRGANEVARKPYVYGGGHGRNPREIWTDSAYDCSGSISYALAAAGFIEGPMASGPMMTWGKPGPGKWVSIYANEGHAFMVVAGLRFDTSGRQRTGSRWQPAPRSTAGFTVRHPPGL